MTKLTRSELLRMMAAWAGAAGLGALAGCGDDDTAPPPDGGAGTNGGDAGNGEQDAGVDAGNGEPTVSECDAEVALAAAHIHELTVPASDANAGEERTYEMSEVAGHTHMVTVSESDFATLLTGASVEIESTEDDAHSHMVTVSCSS